MAQDQRSTDSVDKPIAKSGWLNRATALTADALGLAVLVVLLFVFLVVLVGAVLIILGVAPSALDSVTWKGLAERWSQVWQAITAPASMQALLALLTLLALLGVFPITYYAYQAHRKEVKINRLSDEFLLLGLIKQGERRKVQELYERVYSSRQYLLYILLILAFSVFVLWLYYPLSPLAPAAPGEQQASGLPVISIPVTDLEPTVASSGVLSATDSITQTTGATSSVVLSDTNSITMTTILTTPIPSPAQSITLTTVVTTTIPASAQLTGAQTQPVNPERNDVVRLLFTAYLGAYVYSLFELVRRYNTFDLQPQVYASILVRMVAAVVLVFVGAATIFNSPSTYQSPPTAPGYATIWLPGILAFVIGAFPSRGIDWFRRLADPVLTGRTAATPNALPLENLQGISTWHASRLEQIGIDDAQNLAGADLRELLLTTQFDTQVIVNWVDQAILYTKAGSDITKFREKNIPTFTALKRVVREIELGQDPANERELAIHLGLPNFAELKAFAADAGFANYHNLAQYYARSAQVTSRFAQEAQDTIIGEAQFQNFNEAINFGEEILTLSLDEPDAGLLRTLGTAYYQRAMSRKRLGDIAAAGADFELAVDRFNKAIELDTDNADAYYGRSLCWLENSAEPDQESERWQKTIDDCNTAIARNRSFAEAFNTLAIAYEKQGNLALALQNLEEALRLNDRLAPAYFNRGRLRNKMAQMDQDNALRQQACESSRSALRDYELAYLTGHDDIGAIRFGMGLARRGIAVNCEDVDCLQVNKDQELRAARDILSEAIGLLDESRRSEAYLERARLSLMFSTPKNAAARSDLTWIVNRDPELTTPVARLAWTLRDKLPAE